MGQKVNPIGFRIGFNKTWDSRWFINKMGYAKCLLEDIKIRNYIKATLTTAGISKVVIERSAKKITIALHSARPGIIIGKKGADIDKVKKGISKIAEGEVFINIVEIKKPEIDAQLVAEGIAQQLEKRVAFRRAMKRAIQTSMKLGALGIKISCSGRLGGAEIARTEWYKEGRIPLHTLRADIDFGMARANTTYGVIGITVHVYKGESLNYN
ncbi:MAG: 30S ribosomal protein S3 [Alphaproteobacteria bacterium]|jgi:small subunit ribosomal protein S3